MTAVANNSISPELAKQHAILAKRLVKSFLSPEVKATHLALAILSLTAAECQKEIESLFQIAEEENIGDMTKDKVKMLQSMPSAKTNLWEHI